MTASLARRLGKGGSGPLAAGIAIASAVMYLRVTILMALLVPSALLPFAVVVAPAALVAVAAAIILWARTGATDDSELESPGNPIELLPAIGFASVVAVAAVSVRWAHLRFGQSGIATSLFLTGSLDVDAAVVTLSGLPISAISRELAALALSGTVIANMILKIGIVATSARARGASATWALTASTAILVVGVLRKAHLLGIV